MIKIRFKKYLSMFFGVAMLFSMLIPNRIIAADTTLAITGPISVNTKEENTYSIKLEGNSGFSGFNITVEFDTDMFEYVKSENGTYVMTYDLPDSANNGECIIAAMSSDNVSGDGNLANVILRTKDGASGSSEVKVKVNELFDTDMNDVSVTIRNLLVEVNNPYGDVDDDKEITKKDAAYILKKVLNSDTKLPIETTREGNWMKYADVDKDGYITCSDAALVLLKVRNKNFIFPVEGDI